ncbi:acetyl-CoA carboxylase biotin carboxylase subunit [Candidatus Fokinia crypta]|uniref:propionyl-CoA carboxylase n=1 Tax=Candidatus Fokinia crypta TaxID=1920990 RepID=A0ABZ0URX8_9RICK|nr:acetyl-CoA carboxylase biotin carboxylase subunit [Candidatus Fokinia cryptica]WPX97769.1 Putative acetyl-/propionyl-coenzyme A carboxylase alpha chain [Candidatus Fokinia cryptica]
MINKLLIANRGEIACRIIRTAKRMGIKTVAIYSESDSDGMHVSMADQAVYIGPSPAQLSYLNAKKILYAVKSTGADAVHPGYGFLSENYGFSELMRRNGITFIGPSSDAIRKMGDKVLAKKIAAEAGVNIVPGGQGQVKNLENALKIAKKIGYPVMLKAAAGGGGKGMRVVNTPESMEMAFGSTKNEARNNFADERVFIEKYIKNPRHIEIQVVGDMHGNYICLYERECSIQRRHQKIIEEAPSIFVDEKIRKRMYEQSVALAKKVGYYSVGTVEFIVDEKKNFYFMEMNTRLQVEHPVTELITGVDLVELMITIARGEKLKMKQSDVKCNGWALESRIYAEDTLSGFIPSTGKILTYVKPEKKDWLRIDEGVREGSNITPFYDPMISKVCVWSDDRGGAIEKMRNALSEYVITGVSHNISSFLQKVFSHPKFIAGEISTNFIDDELFVQEDTFSIEDERNAVLLSAASYIFLTYHKRNLATSYRRKHGDITWIGTRWVISMRNHLYPVVVHEIQDGYKVSIENRRFDISAKWMVGSHLFQCTINEKDYSLQVISHHNSSSVQLTFMDFTVDARIYTPYAAEMLKYMKEPKSDEDSGNIVASISGIVTNILVQEGDVIVKGQPVIALEAMKMENILHSTVDGCVTSINVSIGDSASAGDVLVELEYKK